MNEYLDSLERLIKLEETHLKKSKCKKKRQRVIEAGRLVLLESDMQSIHFLSVEMVAKYEELKAAYIESLNNFSYEEVYQRSNHILAFHHFQSQKII